MKKFVFLLFLLQLYFILQTVSAAENIKQVTVNDYLQQATAKAKLEGRSANKLIDESSPYLLQHAYNPVDWYAWGDAAFEKARKENKPIFLSIGYSTCHWCHVMAHESFENKQIAELLNRYFICIKVDREQRPDIDKIYMSATQLINGHGGWPMSVFLDHRLRPFHAATYYPPFSTDGRKGLYEVLLKIHQLWQDQPELVEQVATTVTERIIDQSDETAAAGVLDKEINKRALHDITEAYEPDFGGFSVAPKFPSPGIFSFLTQLALSEAKAIAIEDKTAARKMMKTTLDAMASGGIYDQLAGGFHRYSVDSHWQVPHFEKMLYSQALMVLAYNDFYKAYPLQKNKQVVFETLAFVSQEMKSSGGGFFSALDADSEAVYTTAGSKSLKKSEGAYYLWRASELKRLLTVAEFNFVEMYFSVRDDGNILSDPQDEFSHLNILYIEEEARDKELTQEQLQLLASVKEKLNAVRLQRPRPHLDDKIITAWNGMILAAFARSSLVFDEPAFLEQATVSAGFVRMNLYDDKSGGLYRQYRVHKNKAGESTRATLPDYAWLIYGLLEMYQAGAEREWFDWALELQSKQDELFLDKNTGAYFESFVDDANLLFRSKSIYDGALPSANAVALSNLRRFSEFTGKPGRKKIFSSMADRLVDSFSDVVNQNPSAAAMLLSIELEHASENHLEAEQ